jgi:hypothetical protein
MMQMPMLQQKHNKTEKTAPKALDHCHLDSISCQQIQHIISDMGKCMYDGSLLQKLYLRPDSNSTQGITARRSTPVIANK